MASAAERHTFPELARRAVSDTQLRRNIGNATQTIRAKRAAVVAERDGHVLGYGTLSPFAARGGYFPSTEISVYVAPDAQGMGVGGALTGWLVDFAREEGYSTIISFNTDTNVASIRMIERHGFVRTGLIRHIGVKLGRLVDLAVFQLVFPENLPRYQDEQDTTP